MSIKSILVVAGAVLFSLAGAQTRFILRYTESEPLGQFLARYSLELEDSVPQRPIHAVIDRTGRDPNQVIQQISDDTDDDVSIEQDQFLSLPILSFPSNQTQGLRDAERLKFFERTTLLLGMRVPRAFPAQIAVGQTQMMPTWTQFGGGNATVAVIDTGVDPTHTIFGRNLLAGIDYLTPGGNGSELVGLPGDIRALINPTTTPLLFREFRHTSKGHAPAWEARVSTSSLYGQIPVGLGHGTMVAGAIRLVAPHARILPIRAFAQDGSGRLYHVIRGIHEAEIRGAHIVNLSLNTLTPSPEFERTSDEVSSRGVILVASTGNNGLQGVESFPAAYPKVIGVAAVNSVNVRSQFSNVGPNLAMVAAPGEAVFLPFPGQRWSLGWGTSFSAPMVSGLAAQLRARKSNLTYSDVQSALSRSTPNADPNLGQGTLNVFASVAGM